MGDAVPDDPEPLIDDKWYCMTLEVFQGGPESGCEQTPQGTIKCCKLGVAVNGWRDLEQDCLFATELCVYSGFSSQRIINWIGPYDTVGECNAICGA